MCMCKVMKTTHDRLQTKTRYSLHDTIIYTSIVQGNILHCEDFDDFLGRHAAQVRGSGRCIGVSSASQLIARVLQAHSIAVGQVQANPCAVGLGMREKGVDIGLPVMPLSWVPMRVFIKHVGCDKGQVILCCHRIHEISQRCGKRTDIGLGPLESQTAAADQLEKRSVRCV